MNGNLSQRRADHIFLYDARRSRHFTRLQDVGQVFGFVLCEAAGDLRTTAGDFGVYRWERIYIAVEYDGNGFADVFFGQARPCFGTFGVHFHIDYGAVSELVEIDAGIGDDIAFERRASVAVSGFDGNQLEG